MSPSEFVRNMEKKITEKNDNSEWKTEMKTKENLINRVCETQ